MPLSSRQPKEENPTELNVAIFLHRDSYDSSATDSVGGEDCGS